MGEEIVAGGTVTDPYVRQLAVLGAEIAHVSVEDVLGRTTRHQPSSVRSAIAVALRARGWCLEEIGLALQRDHSSIAHHTLRSQARLAVDPEYRYLVGRLIEEAVRLDGEQSPSEEWMRRRLADLEGALDRLRIDFEALASERANQVITRRREAVA